MLGVRFGDANWSSVMETLRHKCTVVIDQVGGDGFADLLDCLSVGGRYATAGAIAGPIVQLDLRTLYLRDLSLIGETCWDQTVFPNLIRYIEAGQITPSVAKTWPLEEIVEAQKEFMEKKHSGKFVLVRCS